MIDQSATHTRTLPESGCRQVPTWYASSHDVVCDFEVVSGTHRLLRLFTSRYPLYDWIMGFHERWSNRRLLADADFAGAGHILELGVGTGYLLGEIIRRTTPQQQVTAVDLSTQMLRTAQTYLAGHGLQTPRVQFARADCLDLPYPDGCFDLCLSSYLLDLLPDNEIPRALAEMARVLAPGGRACLLTMTTELDACSPLRRWCSAIGNACYCFGYERGRWNPIWRRLFAGYAPHCRPIALGAYVNRTRSLLVQATRITHVSAFAARVYYVQKVGA